MFGMVAFFRWLHDACLCLCWSRKTEVMGTGSHAIVCITNFILKWTIRSLGVRAPARVGTS